MTTATKEPELINKLDGKKSEEVDGWVKEYVSYHKIVHSENPKERINLVTTRQDRVGKIRSQLEQAVVNALGEERVIENWAWADKAIDAIVSKAYQTDLTLKGKMSLPNPKEKAKDRQEAIVRYINTAGVDYGQLIRTLVGMKGKIDVEKLPDGNPLKTLLTYIASKSDKEQDRLAFLQQMIVSTGNEQKSVISQAFNKYGGTSFDGRFATPQEILQGYGLIVQSKLAEYEAKDPNKIQNRAITAKPVVDSAITSTAKDYASQHKS